MNVDNFLKLFDDAKEFFVLPEELLFVHTVVLLYVSYIVHTDQFTCDRHVNVYVGCGLSTVSFGI